MLLASIGCGIMPQVTLIAPIGYSGTRPDFFRKQSGATKHVRNLSGSNRAQQNTSGNFPGVIGRNKMLPVIKKVANRPKKRI